MTRHPPRGSRPASKLAAAQVDPFPQADKAAPAAGKGPRVQLLRRICRASRAVVSDLKCQPVMPVVQRDQRPRPVPACLSTLVSASWITRYAARSLPGDSVHGAPRTHSSTSSPAAVIRWVSVVSWPKPGSGRSCSLGLVASGRAWLWHAKQAQHVLQFGHGRPAARLHGEHGRPGLLLLGAEHLPGGARLHDHHADVVGHHIVQLARDPRPLQFKRAPRRGLMLGLRL